MILNGFLRDDKEDFKQKVSWKNVWVVFLYTHFMGSSFFFFCLKKVPRDEGLRFCYKAVPKSSITHYLRKPFFCLSLDFLSIMLETRLRYSKYYFNFYLIFSNFQRIRHYVGCWSAACAFARGVTLPLAFSGILLPGANYFAGGALTGDGLIVKTSNS